MLKTGIVSFRLHPVNPGGAVSGSFKCRGKSKVSGRTLRPRALFCFCSDDRLFPSLPALAVFSVFALQASTSWAPPSPHEWSRAPRVPSAPQPRASNQGEHEPLLVHRKI